MSVNGKHYVIVHAGYVERDKLFGQPSVEYFYMYSRDEAYLQGGKENSIIVAGHTPTISKKHEVYNEGRIFRYYNEKIKCTYYNIDCGAVFRDSLCKGNMACLRLDDLEEIYLF